MSVVTRILELGLLAKPLFRCKLPKQFKSGIQRVILMSIIFRLARIKARLQLASVYSTFLTDKDQLCPRFIVAPRLTSDQTRPQAGNVDDSLPIGMVGEVNKPFGAVDSRRQGSHRIKHGPT